MKTKKFRYFASDFETTVYKGQTDTQVWASASVELFSDEPAKIFHSIGEQFDYFKSLKSNLIVYYHNLKFDGSFWLSYLLTELHFNQAYVDKENSLTNVEWIPEKDMHNNTFKYCISDMGQWYTIIIKVNGYYIELRDSLKLLPFTLRRIGESFKTKHKKLEMEYTGFRYAGCPITEEEQEYIANDVYVLKEALEIMFKEGHDKLTIGSCCLAEYKKLISKEDYNEMFPDLTKIELDVNTFNAPNADAYIRKSYKGGWCYLVKGKENQKKKNGTTADVNSLYPSMMSSESGNYYPVYKPHFWSGNYIDQEALYPRRYYFVRIRTRFYLKNGKLPFIQIKGSHLYKPTEALETSDVYDPKTDKYYTQYYDGLGNLKQAIVELTLTMTDFQLLKEHYDLVDMEILDGCWFYSEKGIFDVYINKYAEIKKNSKGALRELAKLFLNNLYGKMASSTVSSFKVAYVKDDGSIGFKNVYANDKEAGYIAVGSAITSYARNFTIRAAQSNYHGKDNPGFIYADTDSIHCDLPPEQIVGIKVHDRDFCCWKLESCWDEAIFTRQKTYIEHCTHENLEPVEKPYYNVKCAGMPQHCKDLFVASMLGVDEQDKDKYTEEEWKFVQVSRKLEDFREGLRVPGKLLPKRIRGGVLLVDTYYEMR